MTKYEEIIKEVMFTDEEEEEFRELCEKDNNGVPYWKRLAYAQAVKAVNGTLRWVSSRLGGETPTGPPEV